MSSTSFLSGLVVLVKLCRMSQENGHVEQIKRELDDDEEASAFAGV